MKGRKEWNKAYSYAIISEKKTKDSKKKLNTLVKTRLSSKL
jgi:hypothetical protein